MPNPFDRKNEVITEAEIAFFKELGRIDEDLAKEIIKIYARFVVGRNLELNTFELAKVDDSIIKAIAKTDYKLALNAYIPNFEVIDSWDKKIHEEVNKIDISKTIEENVKISNYRSVIESRLRGTPSTILKYEDIVDGEKVIRSAPIRNTSLDELVNPISEVIKKDIILGVSFDDATATMLNAINEKDLGLEQWASQIAKDALNQSSGIVNDEVRKEFDMKYIRYVGTVKQTTRPICYHILNENPVMEYDEIQEIINPFVKNGVPSDSVTTKTANGKPQKKGNGIIPGTTEENFLVYRGGYNCSHDAIPTLLK